MRPSRMWIDGTSFNILIGKKMTAEKVSEHEELFKIGKKEGEKYFTSFRIPKKYHEKIYSYPDFKIIEFEKHTNTKLNFQENGNIEILGEDYKLVASAREQMHNLIVNIRSKYKPIQFIAIPMLGDEVKENFSIFKKEILKLHNKIGIRGLDETIFMKPEKLHLTIGVMVLLDEIEISEVINLLESHKTDLKEMLKNFNQPTIIVKGIDSMKSNHKKVDVLFAKAALENETDEINLQKIVNNIFNCFYEKGFMKENKEDDIKIHLTLMNTKYRDIIGLPKTWMNRREPFDASIIMEKFGNYNFGKTLLDKIQLCLISTKGEDGFYKVISEISLI